MRQICRSNTIASVFVFSLAGCVASNDDANVTRAAIAPTNVSSSVTASSATPAASRETHIAAYITGYSYWDNTPPGSADIAYPVVHRKAGGTGTYNDPITIAVGHSIIGSKRSTDFLIGTRFYLSSLRKYAVVEDICGDGPRPQAGPCHTGYQGKPWLDIYVDGSGSSPAISDQCARRLTRVQSIIQDPRPDYPVVAGALTESGCRVFSG